jgi:hypothetical protein
MPHECPRVFRSARAVAGTAKVIDCSAAAAALLAHGGSLKVGTRGRLAAASETATKRLRQLITLAATGGGGGLMRMTNPADETFCMVQVAPGGVSTDNPFDPRYAGCPWFSCATLPDHARSISNRFASPWIARRRRRRLPQLWSAGIRRLASRQTEESPRTPSAHRFNPCSPLLA